MIIDRSALNSVKSGIESLGFEHFGTSVRSFIESMENDIRYVLFCSMNGGSVSGYLIISVVCDEAEVIQIASGRDSLRKGVATGLIKECFEYLQKRGVVSLFLEVRASNAPAVSFYEKTGFVVTGMRRNYYSDPVEDAIIMSRKLCSHCPV